MRRLLLPLLLSISACVGPSLHLRTDQALELDASTGVVVGSVTSPSVEHYQRLASFYFRRVPDGPAGRVMSAVKQEVWLQPGREAHEGLELEHGRFFALRLPAGDYEIHELRLLGNSPLAVTPDPLPRFVVRAGEVSYLGAFEVALEIGPVNAYRWNAVGGQTSFARDLNLAVFDCPRSGSGDRAPQARRS